MSTYTEALESSPGWRGHVARWCPWLTADQRVVLAMGSDNYWRGLVAHYAEGLSGEQRVALALATEGDEWRVRVALYVDDLTPEQRMDLGRNVSQSRRGEVANNAPGLSDDQRKQLLP